MYLEASQGSYIDKAVMEMEPKEGGAHPHLSPHGSEHMLLHNSVQMRTRFVVIIIRGELTSHTLVTEAQRKN